MGNSLKDDIQHSFIPRFGAIGWLIVINTGIFLVMGSILVILFLMQKQFFFYRAYNYLTLPTDLDMLASQPWSIFTYMWIHELRGSAISGLFHVAFNMLWLYWIGGRILKPFQPDNRIWFMFVAGALAGGILTILAYNLFPAFDGRIGMMVGASAGVMSIVVATATLRPNHTLYLFFLGPVKLVWVVAFVVIIDFLSIMNTNPGGMIAHLGGGLFGYFYMTAIKNGRDWGTPFYGLFKKREKKSKLRVVSKNTKTKTKSKGKSKADKSSGGKPNQAEVDRILDKIAKVGYENLTKEEKQTLLNASKDD